SYSKKISQNALFNLLGSAFTILVTFAAMPFIVHRLGASSFGVLTLTLTIAGYFTILDIGLGTAIIKFLSEKKNDSNRGLEENSLIGTAMLINLAAGAVGATCLFITAPFIISTFRLDAKSLADATAALRICSLMFFINMSSAVFSAIPQAKQRFDLLSAIRTSAYIIQTLGIVLLLHYGYSLSSVAWCYVASSTFTMIVFFLVARTLMRGKTSFIPFFDKSSCRLLLSFGCHFTVAKLSSILLNSVDKLIIGLFLGVERVSYYAAPFLLTSWIYKISMIVAPVTMPAASELMSLGDKQRLKRLSIRGTKYLLMCSIPPAVFLAAAPKLTLNLWMGPEFALNGSAAMIPLVIGVFLQGIIAVQSMILVGAGKIKLMSNATMIGGIVSVALCFMLTKTLGIAGAATAYAAGAATIAVPVFIYGCKLSNVGFREIARATFLKPTGAAIIDFFFIIAFRHMAGSLIELFVLACASATVYTTSLFILKAIDKDDIAAIRNFIPKH
ncbi:MAG TPA: flippase, partial [bacterium]|nr:flippase [bacterium]